MKKIFFVLIALLSCVVLFGCGHNKMKPSLVLEKIKYDLNTILEITNAQMIVAAKDLSRIGIHKPGARNILQALVLKRKYFIDCATITPEGKLLLIEPKEYKKHEGADISKQSAFIKLIQTKQPVFSDAFTSMEGVSSIVFQYPIFEKNKIYIGSFSILVNPVDMISSIVVPVIKDTNIKISVMQIDGLTVFDLDRKQIGKNVFTDQMFKDYPSLISFCKEVAVKEKGKGSYEFIDEKLGKSVEKSAIWDTVSMNGLVWKIVVYTDK